MLNASDWLSIATAAAVTLITVWRLDAVREIIVATFKRPKTHDVLVKLRDGGYEIIDDDEFRRLPHRDSGGVRDDTGIGRVIGVHDIVEAPPVTDIRSPYATGGGAPPASAPVTSGEVEDDD